MRKRLAVICTLLSVSAWAAPQMRSLSLDDIRRVESLVKMPPGARSIESYNRFYAIKVENGREIIWGKFFPTTSDLPPPTVHIVAAEKMPAGIQDGGCLQVNLFYDVRDAKITFIGCNGLT